MSKTFQNATVVVADDVIVVVAGGESHTFPRAVAAEAVAAAVAAGPQPLGAVAGDIFANNAGRFIVLAKKDLMIQADVYLSNPDGDRPYVVMNMDTKRVTHRDINGVRAGRDDKWNLTPDMKVGHIPLMTHEQGDHIMLYNRLDGDRPLVALQISTGETVFLNACFERVSRVTA